VYKSVQGRKIRVGIVGCGRISKNHFGSMDVHAEHLELAAVCNIDADRLAEHKHRYGVPGFYHLGQMLEQADLDLVCVCTPSGFIEVDPLSRTVTTVL